MSDDHVQLSIDNAIARITIDRLKARNSISLAMAEDIASAVDQAETTQGVRVIALQGAGEWFSAGADLKELPNSRRSPDAAQAYDRQISAAVQRLADCRKPTIALLNGPAMGGSVGFALACDLRIAADRSYVRVPVARNGLFYPPADAARLVRLAGPAIAKWVMMSGETVSSAQCLQWGLVTAVHADDVFEQQATSLLENLAAGAPLSLEYTKLTLDSGPADHRLVNEAYARIYSSPDPMEGINSVLEKRAPVFRGDETD